MKHVIFKNFPKDMKKCKCLVEFEPNITYYLILSFLSCSQF